MLTQSIPIESQFEAGLVHNLNAEIVLGTVTNVKEACTWLGYTYMHSRAVKNPLAYGITWEQLQVSRAGERPGRGRGLVTTTTLAA